MKLNPKQLAVSAALLVDVGLTQPADFLNLLGNLANVEAVHLIETRLQASEHPFQRFIR